MPTYGYECPTCKHSFDAFQKITADPLKTCPKCGNALRRLIGGGVGIIFKGSGFYTTDYKKSSSSGNGSSSKDREGSSKESSSKDSSSKDSSSKDSSSSGSSSSGKDSSSSSGSSSGEKKE